MDKSDEERVDVTITLVGRNTSGFHAEHTNLYKNVRKSDFAKIQQFGAEALTKLQSAIKG